MTICTEPTLVSPQMKTYQNEHVRVSVECNVHLLTQIWAGLPSSENFRDGTLATLALAKRHQIKRWQIDLRPLRLFNPTDLHWFMQHWLPQANQRLIRQSRIAVILTDANQFGKLGADLMIRAALAQNSELSCRYFVNEESVRSWLMSQNP